MIPIGVGISAATLAVAGTVALAAIVLAPPPVPSTTVWLDQPAHGAAITAGPTTIAMHASSERDIRQFRLVISKGPESVVVLNDTTPDAVAYGDRARPLVNGSTEWDAVPGIYMASVSYLDTAGWVAGIPVTITVLDGTPVLPSSPGTIPLPTSPTDTLEPTDPFEPEPEVEPEAEPGPGQPETPTAPQPTTAPTVAPSSPPTTPGTQPSGTVRRTVTGTSTVFVAEGVQPQNAIVDVQYQVTNDFNGPANPSGTWTSMGCGNLTAQTGTSPTKYTCTTAAWTGAGRSASYRTAHVRVQVVSGGSTWTSYGPDWLINPDVA